MYCTHCGKYIPEDSQFCEFCGKQVSKQAQEEIHNQADSDETHINKQSKLSGKIENNKKRNKIIIISIIIILAIFGIYYLFNRSGNNNQSSDVMNHLAPTINNLFPTSVSGTPTEDTSSVLWDQSKHGIIALEKSSDSGSSNSESLVLLNPADFTVIAQKVLPGPNLTRNRDGKQFTLVSTQTTMDALSNGSACPIMMKNANACGQYDFNNTFQYIPVIFTQNTDGSQHIGYYHLEDGTVTDISPDTSSNFNAKVITDSNPIFDPSDANILLFQQNGQNFQYDLTTQTSKPSTLSSNISDNLYDRTNTTTNSSLSSTPVLTINTSDSDNGNFSVKDGSGNNIACSPTIWIDSNNLLCIDNNTNFLKINLGAKSEQTDSYGNKYYQVTPPTKLLPSSQRQNSNPILSNGGNGDTIMFLSSLGSDNAVYTISVNGGQPKKISDIDSSSTVNLLYWR